MLILVRVGNSWEITFGGVETRVVGSRYYLRLAYCEAAVRIALFHGSTELNIICSVVQSRNEWFWAPTMIGRFNTLFFNREMEVESHFDAIHFSSTLSCSSISSVVRITMRRLNISRYHELSYCQYIQHTLFDSELIIPKLSSKWQSMSTFHWFHVLKLTSVESLPRIATNWKVKTSL